MSLQTAGVELDGYDRAANRRAELARAALTTLAQRGYARSSLREIAANSSYSHGIFHYYFESKDDLILECIRTYKQSCVAGYDDLIERCTSADDLRNSFAARVAWGLHEGLDMHRLWYDLRAQTLFVASLRHEITEVDQLFAALTWRVLAAYAALLGTEVRCDPALAYAALDGLFERGVRDLSAEVPGARENVVQQLDQFLRLLVPARALS